MAAVNIFAASIILTAITFLFFWVVNNVTSEMTKTITLIVYGICFLILTISIVIEAFLLSF